MHVLNILFETTGTSSRPRRRSASASAWPGSLGAGVGIGIVFGPMIQSVARQPELRGELQGIMARLRAHRGGRALRPRRRVPRVRLALADAGLLAETSPLTKIIPGLMIWTIVFFLITFFVEAVCLRTDPEGHRRPAERIRQSIEEAERARTEAQQLLEEHRKLIGQARGDADRILTEATARSRRPARAGEGGDRGRPPAPP